MIKLASAEQKGPFGRSYDVRMYYRLIHTLIHNNFFFGTINTLHRLSDDKSFRLAYKLYKLYRKNKKRS